MKKYINKLSIVLLASIIMWCAVPMDVNAEEHATMTALIIGSFVMHILIIIYLIIKGV